MSLVGYARGPTTEGRPVRGSELDAFRASGTMSDRPNLAACLDYLRRRDVLIVLDLDRLGRLASGFSTYNDEFSDRRIGFRGLNSPMNTTKPAGRTFLAIPKRSSVKCSVLFIGYYPGTFHYIVCRRQLSPRMSTARLFAIRAADSWIESRAKCAYRAVV